MLLPATNQTLSSSFQTAPIDMRKVDGFTATIDVSTTNAVGVFYVQKSVDGKTLWTNMVETSIQMNVASANVTYSLDFNSVQGVYIRFAYFASTGTGTCNIQFDSKAVSGMRW